MIFTKKYRTGQIVLTACIAAVCMFSDVHGAECPDGGGRWPGGAVVSAREKAGDEVEVQDSDEGGDGVEHDRGGAAVGITPHDAARRGQADL